MAPKNPGIISQTYCGPKKTVSSVGTNLEGELSSVDAPPGVTFDPSTVAVAIDSYHDDTAASYQLPGTVSTASAQHAEGAAITRPAGEQSRYTTTYHVTVLGYQSADQPLGPNGCG